MQQQIVSSINLHNDDNKTDCFRYIVKQCHFYIENFGMIVKKVLCKPWPIISKQSTRKKKKQVSPKRNLAFILIFSLQLFTIPHTSTK